MKQNNYKHIIKLVNLTCALYFKSFKWYIYFCLFLWSCYSMQILNHQKTLNKVHKYWRFSTAWYGTVRYGTVRYGSLLGGFPLGTVPGTWYFFSTTSVEVPSSRTVTKTWRVNSADHWLAGENRHYCITELATTRPSSTARPARFKSAQPAKDRTQLLFKQTHIFASTTK